MARRWPLVLGVYVAVNQFVLNLRDNVRGCAGLVEIYDQKLPVSMRQSNRTLVASIRFKGEKDRLV